MYRENHSSSIRKPNIWALLLAVQLVSMAGTMVLSLDEEYGSIVGMCVVKEAADSESENYLRVDGLSCAWILFKRQTFFFPIHLATQNQCVIPYSQKDFIIQTTYRYLGMDLPPPAPACC